jgi:hypothetical protein
MPNTLIAVKVLLVSEQFEKEISKIDDRVHQGEALQYAICP